MKQKQNETEHLLSTEANRYRLLEDAAERLYPDCNNLIRQMAKETFINGAKWQSERSYSEEEVINSFTDDQIEKLKNLFGEEKTIEQIYDDFFETIDIYNNIKNQLQG
jgi:hypothetical protein